MPIKISKLIEELRPGLEVLFSSTYESMYEHEHTFGEDDKLNKCVLCGRTKVEATAQMLKHS